jgi:hypothetical protein
MRKGTLTCSPFHQEVVSMWPHCSQFVGQAAKVAKGTRALKKSYKRLIIHQIWMNSTANFDFLGKGENFKLIYKLVFKQNLGFGLLSHVRLNTPKTNKH